MSKLTFSARLSPRATLIWAALGLSVAACGKSDSKETPSEVKPEGNEAASDSTTEVENAPSENTEEAPSAQAEGEVDTNEALARRRGARPMRGERGPRGERGRPEGAAEEQAPLGERPNPGERPPPVRDLPNADANTAQAAENAPTGTQDLKQAPPSANPVLPENGAFAQAEAPSTDSIEAPSSAEARANLPAIDPMRILPLTIIHDTVSGHRFSYSGPLAGIAVGSGYTSAIFASSDKNKLGVTLQLWQDPTRRETDERYRRMRMQYPNAEDITQMNPVKAYYSTFKNVQTITFGDSLKRTVGSVSCSADICTHDQLLKLARSARDRL